MLVGWLDRGKLQPGTLSFSPLEALDPDVLVTRFGRELEVAGHTPRAALDHYDGTLPSGFEEALRTSHWAALEWWLYELPQLANLAPPSRGAQMAWVPLQRVLLPGYLADPEAQARHGPLPDGARRRTRAASCRSIRGKNVIAFAAAIKSPMVAVLDAPAPRVAPMPATTLAQTAPAAGDASCRATRLAAGAPGGALRSDVAANALAALSAAPRRLSRWRSCRGRRARAPAGTPGRAWIFFRNAISFGRLASRPARIAAASTGKLIWMSAALNSAPANHSLAPARPP